MIWSRLSPRMRWFWLERERYNLHFNIAFYVVAIIVITTHVVLYYSTH